MNAAPLEQIHAALAVVRGFVSHCEMVGELDLPPRDRARLETLAHGLEELVERLR